MDNTSLHALNTEEYGEAVKGSLGTLSAMLPFLHFTLLPRTEEYLQDVLDQVNTQIARVEGFEYDEDWMRRTRGFRGLLQSRLALTKKRIREDDDRRERKHATALNNWKRFAHILCEVIELSDLEYRLDEIDAPYGEITAGGWLDRRIEKQPERTGVNA